MDEISLNRTMQDGMTKNITDERAIEFNPVKSTSERLTLTFDEEIKENVDDTVEIL